MNKIKPDKVELSNRAKDKADIEELQKIIQRKKSNNLYYMSLNRVLLQTQSREECADECEECTCHHSGSRKISSTC